MIADYCGYCGIDFERYADDPPEICAACHADSDVRKQYEEDSAYASAEAAHDEEHRQEQRRFYT